MNEWAEKTTDKTMSKAGLKLEEKFVVLDARVIIIVRLLGEFFYSIVELLAHVFGPCSLKFS